MNIIEHLARRQRQDYIEMLHVANAFERNERSMTDREITEWIGRYTGYTPDQIRSHMAEEDRGECGPFVKGSS